MTHKIAVLGAAAGLVLFLAVALLPSAVYGGFAGVMLAGGLFGLPLEASLPARAIIAAGMLGGVVLGATAFSGIGAAATTGCAALVRSLPERRASRAA